MSFVQIIEGRTDKMDELLKLDQESSSRAKVVSSPARRPATSTLSGGNRPVPGVCTGRM